MDVVEFFYLFLGKSIKKDLAFYIEHNEEFNIKATALCVFSEFLLSLLILAIAISMVFNEYPITGCLVSVLVLIPTSDAYYTKKLLQVRKDNLVIIEKLDALGSGTQ